MKRISIRLLIAGLSAILFVHHAEPAVAQLVGGDRSEAFHQLEGPSRIAEQPKTIVPERCIGEMKKCLAESRCVIETTKPLLPELTEVLNYFAYASQPDDGLNDRDTYGDDNTAALAKLVAESRGVRWQWQGVNSGFRTTPDNNTSDFGDYETNYPSTPRPQRTKPVELGREVEGETTGPDAWKNLSPEIQRDFLRLLRDPNAFNKPRPAPRRP